MKLSLTFLGSLALTNADQYADQYADLYADQYADQYDGPGNSFIY